MMIVSSPIKTCTKHVLPVSGHFQKQLQSHIQNVASPATSSSCCFILKQGVSRIRCSRISVPSKASWFADCSSRAFQWLQCRSGGSNKKDYFPLLTIKSSVKEKSSQETSTGFSLWPRNARVRRLRSDLKCSVGLFSWSKGYSATGLILGLLVCYSTANSAHAEAPKEKGDKKECIDPPTDHCSHGKEVYNDYSVIGK